jgi:hypothetical protein
MWWDDDTIRHFASQFEPDEVFDRDNGPLQLAEQEAQVVADLFEGERLVVDDGIDAEAAGIGASHAADHGNDLEDRRKE